MAKRKSSDLEQAVAMKCKTKDCSVNMAELNPALWICNLSKDVSKGRNMQKSIIQLMHEYANSKEPTIPLLYISLDQIYKIIVLKEKLAQHSNIEVLIRGQNASAGIENLPKLIKKQVKSTFKRLQNREFRKTKFFKSIKITSEGLFEAILCNLMNFDFDDIFLADEDAPAVEVDTGPELDRTNIERIVNNCQTIEQFVANTNVIELAEERIAKLGYNNLEMSDQKKIIAIILTNTWNRIGGSPSNSLDSVLDSIDTHMFNFGELLYKFSLDRMRERNYEQFDRDTIVHVMTRYSKYDRNLVPITYLKNSEFSTLFPNHFTFIKYTNIFKVLRPKYRLRRSDIIKRSPSPIICIKLDVTTMYNRLSNEPNFEDDMGSRQILVNCKFLFGSSQSEIVQEGNIVDEIVEYFTKHVQPDESSPEERDDLKTSTVSNQTNNDAADMQPDELTEKNRMDVNSAVGNIPHLSESSSSYKSPKKRSVLNSSNMSNTSTGTVTRKYRNRAKMLLQIEQKLNAVNEKQGYESSSEEEVQDSSGCSEFNVTVVHCDSHEIDDSHANVIVVSEYNTPQKDKSYGVSIEKNDAAIPVTFDLNQEYSNEVQSNPQISTESESIIFVPNSPEVITIEHSITDTERMANILNESSSLLVQHDANATNSDLSEMLEVSYRDVVTTPNKIMTARIQNCQKKISKNPEREIPVMRNTYQPLAIKKTH